MTNREMREHDRRMGEREVCETPHCGVEVYRKGLCRDCYEGGREDAADRRVER